MLLVWAPRLYKCIWQGRMRWRYGFAHLVPQFDLWGARAPPCPPKCPPLPPGFPGSPGSAIIIFIIFPMAQPYGIYIPLAQRGGNKGKLGVSRDTPNLRVLMARVSAMIQTLLCLYTFLQR